MTATFDVLLQGSPFADLTFTFRSLPELPGLGQEVWADDFALNPGGVFNIAAALTRLGLRVGLRTRLGNDLFSRFIAERMEAEGISLELTTWVDRPLPVITAGISFPRDRLFVSYAPPNEQLRTAEPITVADLERYRPAALFSYGELGEEVYAAAREWGIVTLIDTFWNPEHLRSDALRHVLPQVAMVTANLPEALTMTGAATADEALECLAPLCRRVVIKCGADGCIAAHGEERYRVPAIPVEAVDTTGAGDNFNAGLLYGCLKGYSFEDALHCANITGGLSTTVLSGARGPFTAGDVEAHLAVARERSEG